MATKNGVKYTEWFIPADKYSLKAPYSMKPKKITYHNTDNEASARAEIGYMRRNNSVTGYHVAVDEMEAIQGIPFNRNAYHSGDGIRGFGNRNTIGVEICRNYDRSRKTTNLNEPLKSMYSKAEINAVKVGAQIMYEEGIAPTLDNVKFHNDWSGKNCPSKILNERRGNAFKAMAVAEAVKYKAKMDGTTSRKTGWIEDKKGWWYRESNGGYPRSTWKLVNGHWYLFNSSGYMLTGWRKVKGVWYYMSNSGAVQTGWKKIKDEWYYFHTNGAMRTGWQKVGRDWYYMNSKGVMQTYWYQTKADGPWYYSNGSGRLQTGWIKSGGRWFYSDNNGVMQTGLITVSGKYYYMKSNGVMASDEEVVLKANKSGHLK